MKQLKIIDCHTHCYPPEVAADPRTWAEAHNEPHWAELVAPTDRQSIQGWATQERMLKEMDTAGVEKAVLLGWYWENESTCRWHNEVIADWVHRAPDRFIGFASIDPNGDVISQLETAKALGLRGVGELHTGVQKFDANSKGWKILSDWCVANNWPINLHATEAAGHPHPGNIPTPLNTFVQMAARSPKLKMILAHWGGGLPFFEQNPKLRKILKNVYYDTSASPLLYDDSIFQNVIDLVGPGKILFGSDYPLRIYPKEQQASGYARFIQSIQELPTVETEQLHLIFYKNASKCSHSGMHTSSGTHSQHSDT